MNKVNSAGILFVYLIGRLVGKTEVEIDQVNSYTNALDFYNKIKETRKENFKKGDIEIFCVCGNNEKVDNVVNIIDDEIKSGFNSILEGKILNIKDSERMDWLGNAFRRMLKESIFEGDNVRYPYRYFYDDSELKMCCYWSGVGPDDNKSALVSSCVKTWVENEKPILLGKQVMIQSFQLKDLINRKVIAVFPDRKTHHWILLFEGGVKLYLSSEIPYIRERIGMNDLEKMTICDADTILDNPAYAYKKFFYPIELYNDWYKVFLYSISLKKCKLTQKIINFYYEKFLEFIQENICEFEEVPVIIEKSQFNKVIFKNISKFKEFLSGKEEEVLSKDLLMLLNSHYIFLPYMYELLEIEQEQVGEVNFNRNELINKIKKSQNGNRTKKGVLWEDVAEYFVKNVNGLRVTGKRIKTGFQEIDISAINISLDNNLWGLGAYILIECKNWDKKVGIKVVRELAHIANLKGNKTILLFAANGITKNAEEEILRSAANGKFIIVITKNDLEKIEKESDCYDLILYKYDLLKDKQIEAI